MGNAKTKKPRIYTININKPQSLRLAIYGTILTFLAAGLFASITGNSSNGTASLLLAILAYYLAIVAHEAVHGFFFKVFGGKPKYGAGVMYGFLPYAYATTPNQPYTLWQMSVIGISPFFVISGLSIALAILYPSAVTYATVAFVGNFAGAVGDMWLLRQVWRFRKISNLLFVDLRNGIAVHGSGQNVKPVVTKMQKLDNPETYTAKFTKLWAASSLIIMAIVGLITILLGLFNFEEHILIGPSQFPLFEYTINEGSTSFTLGVFPIIVSSLIFSVLYTWLTTRKSISNK